LYSQSCARAQKQDTTKDATFKLQTWLDRPGQSAGNKKPAEQIAMRVFSYFSVLLQVALDVACETVVGADGLEPPTYAL
jgi:hypothetical protein